jgi:hypothetical protein
MISRPELVSLLESAFVCFSAIQVGEFIKVIDTNTFKKTKIIGVVDITFPIELSYIIQKIIYVTDISLWEVIDIVYSYLFDNSMHTSIIFRVSKLIHSDMLIRIETTTLNERE